MDDLAAMSALRLRDALARRELSVTDVTEYFLGRIRTHNERLGAFSSVDHAGALDVAQQRDREFPDDEHARPVLWGVPTADKDLSDRLGMPTGHGSAAGGEFPPESSPEVVALDRAGAVSLGKTATPEFGLYGYTSPAVGPIARHPRDGLLGAGGSSGGAATAVAAGLLPIAPGSDGGGSIRIPAASVGIVGFKPSRDLLPIDQGRGEITGVVSGALARTVEDAALMMDALGQPWSTHQPSQQQSFLSAASEGSHRATEELRIGFTLQHPWRDSVDIVIHPAVVRAFDRVVHLLSAQPNLDLSDAVTFPSTAYAPLFQRAWQRAAAGIDARFDRSRMEPVTQQLIAAGARLSPAEQAANQTALHQFGEDLARRFSKFDVVVTPALAEPWHRAEGWSEDAQENFDAQVRLAPYSSWVNVAGLPAVTLPTPMTATSPGSAELPVSIQLIGQRNTDRELIRFAAAVEALFTREAAALRR